MNDQPQTWHYGIIAQHWAEFENYAEENPDIAYYQQIIEREGGQPVLDVGCGTGRLLIPYLRAGLDVDGCDISQDMLTLCAEKARREGFAPTLYPQPMHQLEIPRIYQTIYVCGAFGIGSTREQDMIALQRFHQHLAPGGLLLLEIFMPYGESHNWQWEHWLQENRRNLDPNWWPEAERDRTADGREFVTRSRIANLDPLEQTLTLQMHVELWQDGRLVSEEERTLTHNIYFKNEVLLMLKHAGFDKITVRGDFTQSEANPEHDVLVFIARK